MYSRWCSVSVLVLLLQCFLLLNSMESASSSMVKGRAIMCYWGSWSIYRNGVGMFDASKINPNMCSHIIYAFAGLRNSTTYPAYTIHSFDPWGDLGPCENGYVDSYGKVVALRKINPGLKVLLSVGGYNAGSQVFSNMSSTANNRQIFISSVVKFLLRYDFDGLDLDWEYPAARDGRPEDRPNFTLLVQELRKAFDGVVRDPSRSGLQLTATLPAGLKTLENGYELKNISQYLHYINLETYALHSFYNDGPYLYHHTGMDRTGSLQDINSTNNIKSVVDYVLNQGVPAKQVVLGIPAFGTVYQMSRPELNHFFDPAVKPTTTLSQYSNDPFSVYYFELCEWIISKNLTGNIVRDATVVSPYVYDDKYWISYDDVVSVEAKARYAVLKGLGGAMVWSIESDDFNNRCNNGVGPNPITTTIRMVFSNP